MKVDTDKDKRNDWEYEPANKPPHTLPALRNDEFYRTDQVNNDANDKQYNSINFHGILFSLYGLYSTIWS